MPEDAKLKAILEAEIDKASFDQVKRQMEAALKDTKIGGVAGPEFAKMLDMKKMKISGMPGMPGASLIVKEKWAGPPAAEKIETKKKPADAFFEKMLKNVPGAGIFSKIASIFEDPRTKSMRKYFGGEAGGPAQKGGAAGMGGMGGLLGAGGVAGIAAGAVMAVLDGIKNILSKVWDLMKRSSPMLLRSLKMLEIGFMLAIRPLADTIARIMMPIARFFMMWGRAVYATYRQKFQELTAGGMNPIQASITASAQSFVEGLIGLFTGVVGGIDIGTSLFVIINEITKAIINAIPDFVPYLLVIPPLIAGAILTALGAMVVGVAEAIWNGLTSFFKGIWSALEGFGEWVWNGLTSFFGGVFNAIAGFGIWLWNGITSAIGSLADWLGGLGTWLWNTITSAIGGLADWLGDLGSWLWNGITSAVGGLADWLGDFGSWLWDSITSAFGDLGDWLGDLGQWLWDSITGAFKGAGDWFGDVGKGIGDFFGGIGNALGLQGGGVVTKPTLAVIGEAGDEAVIPLDRGLPITGTTPEPQRMTLNVEVKNYAPIYGVQDLERTVAKAVEEAVRRNRLR